MGYDFEVLYRAGTTNVVADALSRQFEVPLDFTSVRSSALALTVPQFSFLDELRAEVSSDPFYQTPLTNNTSSNVVPNSFQLKNVLLYKYHKSCLNLVSPLKPKVLFEFHNTPLAGHGGVKKTLLRLAACFYWPNMNKYVQHYVANCHICQQKKYNTAEAYCNLFQFLEIFGRMYPWISLRG